MKKTFKKYIKKIIIIEARGPIEEREEIKTLEGNETAFPGDMIIKGVKGELYPSNRETFDKNHDDLQPEIPNSPGTWKKYQKKRVIVQAAGPIDEPFDIETKRGTLHADKGDFIIKMNEDDIYPCKPDVFHKSYDEYFDD